MTVDKTRRLVNVGSLEWRNDSSGCTLEGYASTFNQSYDMGWYTESISQGAFTKTLSENPDVRLLINHEGLPLARTRSGTLQLSQDSMGLHVRSVLDPNDPDVQSIMPKIARGDLGEMSFAFSTVRQNWSEDYSTRELTELSLANGDVSVVTYPANPATSLTLRSLSDENPAALRELYKSLREEREGADYTPEVAAKLAAILESLGTVDDHLDDAMQTLANMLGVPDPDADDDANEPIEDDSSTIAAQEDNGMQFNAGRSAATVRARVMFEMLRR